MKRGSAALACLALLLLSGAALWLTGQGDGAPAAATEGAATIVISAPPSESPAEAAWAPVPSGAPGTVVYTTRPPASRASEPPPDGASAGAAWTPVPSGAPGTVIYTTQSPAPEDGAGYAAGADYDFSQVVPETGPVEEDYFADALFIGDSRTDGFRLYSGLVEGDYIVKTGLSVFQVETEEVKVDGEKMTVPQALARKSYGKVYVCLGLNELGMNDDEGYYRHYGDLIDRVRAAQPGAVLYIQLLIPVNAQKCAEKGAADYVTNGRIDVYNDLLRALAQEKQAFLLDPAQAIVDGTGQPPYDAVSDGIHFKKEPYQQWLDYLKRHTVRKGEWE